MSDPDVQPEDALQVAQRALSKIADLERTVEEQAGRIDEFEEDLTAVTLRLSAFDEDRAYDALTRDDKVGRVREHGFERSVDGGGTATLDYNDIQWGVFDGEPSADHCYTLMRLAADADGFAVRDPDGRSKHLAVDAAEAKRGAAFSSANNAGSEGVF